MDNPYHDRGVRFMLFEFFEKQLERGKTGEQALDNALDYFVEELESNIIFSPVVEDVYDQYFADQFTERNSIVDAG